jgi:hypothetical protein
MQGLRRDKDRETRRKGDTGGLRQVWWWKGQHKAGNRNYGHFKFFLETATYATDIKAVFGHLPLVKMGFRLLYYSQIFYETTKDI